MRLEKIKELIKAHWLLQIPAQEDIDIQRVGAADLLSDVLTLSNEAMLLITGMTGIQTIRTAEMSDNILAIIFVRGKKIDENVLNIASQIELPLLVTKYSMYETCGILYKNNLLSVQLSYHG